MRVVSTANKGSSLSVEHFESGYTSSSEFDLEIGKEYVVYGISFWKGLLNYLVIGEGMYPSWYPAELFTVLRSEIPPGWHFTYRSKKDGYEVAAVWGYEELVNSEDHFDDLSNLEQKALDVFAERRKQVDKSS